jgi:hypothetical protein
MKNNNELDQIVESFLSPAPVKESMGLKELFALFEEMQKINEVSSPLAQMGVDPKLRGRGAEESYKTEFFTLMQNALGDFLTSVGTDNTSEYSFSSIIDIIEDLKKGKLPPNKNSQTIAIITFVEALYDMIYAIQPDNPDVAGKMFERFVAFATKGKVSSQLVLTEPELAQKIGASNRSIFDVTTQTNEFVSVKLLGSFKVTGSINNLYKFVSGVKDDFVPIPQKIPNNGQSVTYIVTIKEDQNTLVFYSFIINSNNFIDIIGANTIDKYNKSLDVTNSMIKLQKQFDINDREIQRLNNKLLTSLGSDDRELALAQLDSLNNKQLNLKNDELELSNLKASRPSFSIGKEKAESYKQSALWGKKLSITVEEKETIVQKNTLSFKTSIKGLIDEATAVYYKVNNLLLKMEDPNADLTQKTAFGQEAYDSASSLERGILSLSKEKELDVKETSKPS